MRRSMAVTCAFVLASIAASAAPPSPKAASPRPAARVAVPPARALAPHAGRVFGLTFSEDGSVLASGSADETVRVYAVPSGELQLTLPGHGGGAGAVLLSRAGNRLAVSCYDGTVKIWALPEGRLVGTAKGPEGRGHHLAASANGFQLAIGSQDGTIQIVNFWDGTLERTIEAHAGGIQALRYDLFDRVYSSGADGLVKAWHPNDGELLGSLGPQRGPTTHLAFIFAPPPQGAHVMTGGSGVEIWSHFGWSDYTRLARIDAHTGFLNGMGAGRDGATVVTGGGDGAIRVWSVLDGKLVQTIRAHPGVNGLDKMALSNDGATVVSAGWNGTVKVWSLPGGALRATYADSKNWLQSMALSQDGRWLAQGLQGGQVLLRDLGAR